MMMQALIQFKVSAGRVIVVLNIGMMLKPAMAKANEVIKILTGQTVFLEVTCALGNSFKEIGSMMKGGKSVLESLYNKFLVEFEFSYSEHFQSKLKSCVAVIDKSEYTRARNEAGIDKAFEGMKKFEKEKGNMSVKSLEQAPGFKKEKLQMTERKMLQGYSKIPKEILQMAGEFLDLVNSIEYFVLAPGFGRIHGKDTKGPGF